MARRKKNVTLKPATGLRRGRSVGTRLQSQHIKRKPRLVHDIGLLLSVLLALVAVVVRKALVLAVITAALLGGWSLLATSEALAVRQAQVVGNQHLSTLDVLRAAGVGIHSNVLSLNVGRIKQKLLQLPWVMDAAIQRRPPHGVLISVSERQPVALALAGGHIYCLDADMRAFAALDGQIPLDLPIVNGLSKADILEPDEDVEKLTSAASHVLGLLPHEGLPGHRRLSEIHLDRVWGLSLVFDGLTPTVRLGFDNFGPKLRRMVGVTADLENRGELNRATLIDLDHDNRVVVRLTPEAA